MQAFHKPSLPKFVALLVAMLFLVASISSCKEPQPTPDPQKPVVPITPPEPIPEKVVVNPLTYFSEYNLRDLEGNWDTEHKVYGTNSETWDNTYLFQWAEAMAHYGKPEGIEIDGKTYFMPTKEEWLAIVPEFPTGDLRFPNTKVRPIKETVVTIGGESFTMSGSSVGTGEPQAYASWSYIPVDQKQKPLYVVARYTVEPLKGLRIEMCETEAPTPIEEASSPSLWEKLTPTTKLFPSAGFRYDAGNLGEQGISGYYWSTTSLDENGAVTMSFNSLGAFTSWDTKKGAFSVRLLTRK